jgi:FKBP-type peptidyl-prolyl cis-trans isomerase
MGFKVESIKPGNGQRPQTGNLVTIHYTHYLSKIGGKVLGSSRTRGKPFQFKIGQRQVIRYWDEGVALMSVGETAYITCDPPTCYAYGSKGVGDIIPPNSTLVFEVELLKID